MTNDATSSLHPLDTVSPETRDAIFDCLISLFAGMLVGDTRAVAEMLPAHVRTPEVADGVLALMLAALPDDDSPGSAGELRRRLLAVGVTPPEPYPIAR